MLFMELPYSRHLILQEPITFQDRKQNSAFLAAASSSSSSSPESTTSSQCNPSSVTVILEKYLKWDTDRRRAFWLKVPLTTAQQLWDSLSQSQQNVSRTWAQRVGFKVLSNTDNGADAMTQDDDDDGVL